MNNKVWFPSFSYSLLCSVGSQCSSMCLNPSTKRQKDIMKAWSDSLGEDKNRTGCSAKTSAENPGLDRPLEGRLRHDSRWATSSHGVYFLQRRSSDVPASWNRCFCTQHSFSSHITLQTGDLDKFHSNILHGKIKLIFPHIPTERAPCLHHIRIQSLSMKIGL